MGFKGTFSGRTMDSTLPWMTSMTSPKPFFSTSVRACLAISVYSTAYTFRPSQNKKERVRVTSQCAQVVQGLCYRCPLRCGFLLSNREELRWRKRKNSNPSSEPRLRAYSFCPLWLWACATTDHENRDNTVVMTARAGLPGHSRRCFSRQCRRRSCKKPSLTKAVPATEKYFKREQTTPGLESPHLETEAAELANLVSVQQDGPAAHANTATFHSTAPLPSNTEELGGTPKGNYLKVP